MAIKPEDILPDEANSLLVKGITVRKGTMAAVLANLKLLDSPGLTKEERRKTIDMIKELAPALVVTGFSKYLSFKNPEIQKILDDAAEGIL